MAKNKNTPPAAAPLPKATPEPATFEIKRPFLWLSLAVLLLYLPTLQYGFTELDDSIFIRELRSYNEDIGNFFVSFGRGVFDATKDDYYRPFFLNSMLLNYQVSGVNIAGYHLVNVLLHLACVWLLFGLFKRLGIREMHAFLLTLLFAVHPVLTQAVTWIPGRNDTLLALFLIPFFSRSIDYAREGKMKSLLWAAVLLLCGLLTKETAVFAAPAAFVLLVFVVKQAPFSKKSWLLYGAWIGAFGVYIAMRMNATLRAGVLEPAQMVSDFFHRMPVLVQYLGKIFLPFNLSVFPIIEDTVFYFGIAAVAILIFIIARAKNKNIGVITGGLLFFLLMLTPALFVPDKLNVQTFEHRLYLPIIGILLLLPQTVLFRNKLKDNQLIAAFAGLALLFSILNFRQQQYFRTPFIFWQRAAETSPHSAYAMMMYAARMDDASKPESYRLMREAYQLNPNEKYLNYYYAVMLQNQDSVLASEKYLLKEKKISDYYEVDFYLARVAITKNDTSGAQHYLESYLLRDSMNAFANNNLLLIYLQQKEKEKAAQQISTMRRREIPVPGDAVKMQEAM